MKNIFIEVVNPCPICKRVPEMTMLSSGENDGFCLMLVCSKIMFATHTGVKPVFGVTAEETAKRWNRMVKKITTKHVVDENKSKAK